MYCSHLFVPLQVDNNRKETKMANIPPIPVQGQILVNIEDMSMLKDIKKAISMVKGVGKITLPNRSKLEKRVRRKSSRFALLQILRTIINNRRENDEQNYDASR